MNGANALAGQTRITFDVKSALAQKFPSLYLDMNAAWVARGAAIAW